MQDAIDRSADAVSCSAASYKTQMIEVRMQTAAVLPVTRRKVTEVQMKSTTVLSAIRWYLAESGTVTVLPVAIAYGKRG